MDIGVILNNRYTVDARLGKGAMGTVYRAADAQTGQTVALKVIARELAFDPEMLERFKREGEALRQLRHPNIVGFVDAFQHDEQYMIVLEYVPGGSLHDLIKQGPLPLDRARQIALDLCDALIRAHRLNIVHRDLKPENVLLAEDGIPKLTDFGVARLVSDANRLTGTGTQIGTPFYMAPEAWEGKPLDAQADIWSLGIVLYEMLSGEVPFGGETLVAVMNKVLTAPLPELKTKRPDVPDGLTQIARRMLTRDKSQRYLSMREVAADLERGGPQIAQSSLPASPTVPGYTPPTKKTPAAKPAPRAAHHNGWAIFGVGLAFLGLVIGPILILLGGTQDYLGGPLWVIATLTLTAAILSGWRGLREERKRPSRWGRWESRFSLGMGGVGIVALAAVIMIVAPRFFAGRIASSATPAPATSPSAFGGLACSAGETELFADDFEDGQPEGWNFVVDSPPSIEAWPVQLQENNYVLAANGAGRAEVGDLTWENYSFQARIRFVTSEAGANLNIYRAPQSRYALDLVTSQLLREPPMLSLLGQAQATLNDGKWHTIKLTTPGNSVKVLVDGAEALTVNDAAPLTNGYVALENLGGAIWYDDVLVCQLPLQATVIATEPAPTNAALADAWGALKIAPGESVVLGGALDLSGESSQLGIDQQDAVALAVGDHGPVAGFSVMLNIVDTADSGQAAAEILLRDSPAAVVGTTSSKAMAEAMPLFESAHIVVISPSTTADNLSQQGWETFNRLSLPDLLNPGGEPVADPSSPAYQSFAAKFKTRFGRDCCQPYAAEAYDAATILLKSIESVAAVDEQGQLIIPRQKLAQTVRNTRLIGYSGVIAFDKNGDRLQNP